MPDNFFNLNNPDFFGILFRFVINLAFMIVLIRVIYFRYSKKEKFLFTFFMLGITVFFISSMLKSVFIEFGMAVGLFAIFTILRFRTRNFSLKDMSYIFTTIGISLINSLKLSRIPDAGGHNLQYNNYHIGQLSLRSLLLKTIQRLTRLFMGISNCLKRQKSRGS